ncbi:class I SAM-dependent methyltransferase [Pseudomonas sp. SGAir0191]|uniref:class I SAM-dependent methyltransferase n=1 Tax=Pseudomonas sp. SGAir0191 TaxID=2217867 RepID=UPI000C2B83CC|nr:class I SAM-dependent methyltransferase [Pseudomonas sp. SGAir0191]AUA33640.1 class I SAM-dependent methyltransferase [Pseudomonas sp. SGAir0191]
MSINSKRRRDLKKAKRKPASGGGSGLQPRALYQLNSFRKAYIKSWGINSEGHLAQGHYPWMAERVKGFPRTLEIGCGVGHSTLALLQQGHTVVCVEENPQCIAATRKRLADEGFCVEVIARETPVSLDENAYRLIYSEIPEAPEADCLLIEGDALNDPALEAWLERQPKFDAVACWLLGTHDARGHNAAVDLALMPTAYEHRIFVQNRVYEIADRILRSGGVLSVIDRAQTPTTQDMVEKLLQHHREQASVTSLVVQPVEHTPHVESEQQGAMRMMTTNPLDAAMAFTPDDPPTMSLCSTTSVKP